MSLPDGRASDGEAQAKAVGESRQYAVLLDGANVPDLERVLQAFRHRTRHQTTDLEVTPDADARTIH